MRDAHVQSGTRYVWRFALLSSTYFVSARFGLGLSAQDGIAAVVWPPSGIAVAALGVWGLRLWPAVALAAFAVNASLGVPLIAATGAMLGNTLEALVGAACLARFALPSSVCSATARQVIAFIALSAFASPVLSATIGVTAAYVAGVVSADTYTLTWRIWWLGDVLGVLVVVPLLLSLPLWRREPLPRARWLEALLTALALLGASLVVFVSPLSKHEALHAYLVFPPLLWAIKRFQQAGAAAAVALIAVIAVLGTQAGFGPFVFESPEQRLLVVQAFVGVVAITALLFGSVSAERDQASRQLLSEHAFAAAVLDAAGLLVVLDPDGRIVRCNRACERHGFVPHAAGTPFTRVFTLPGSEEETERALHELARTQAPTAWESRCDSDRGERVIAWSGSALLHPNGKLQYLIASGNDVTERRRLESQLVTADRLAAMGTLAAGVGHEINNPLAYTMMSLELAQQIAARNHERSSDWHDVEERMQVALEGAGRVRRIVRDLRTLSRVDDEQRGPVDIHRALDTSIQMAWNEIRHRARLTKDFHPVPMVDVSEGRLGQVFLNLLMNAAQAIPEGSAADNEIRVRTDVDEQGRVVIEVSDTGMGIEPQLRGRLFDPFFTTKPVGAGVGLGLSVCHAIVASVSGTLDVDSEVGKGTTFRVTLPPSKTTRAATRATPVLRSLDVPAPLRILIADDEQAIGQLLSPLLADHTVDLAASGREALTLCQTHDYDLVLSDLLMPELTGMDLYAELARTRPGYEQKIVFMTGGAFTPRSREFLARVNRPVLQKPFSSQELLTLVAMFARAAGRVREPESMRAATTQLDRSRRRSSGT